MQRMMSCGEIRMSELGRLMFSNRVNYSIHNYCSICAVKYPKHISYCLDCGRKLRTKPHRVYKRKIKTVE